MKHLFQRVKKLKHIYHEDELEYEIPLNSEYITVCCDCCLVHREIYTLRDGKLFFVSRRDNRATGQYRRHSNNVVVERNTD